MSTAGGASLVVMRGPVRPGVPQPRRLPGSGAQRAHRRHPWEPSAKPFMTVILTFEDLGGGKTRYTARARHWTEADRETHEKMGFTEGWGLCTSQLAELAATL